MKNTPRILGPFVLPAAPLFYFGLTAACVASGFFLVLKVGFLLHHDPMPAIFADSKLTGLAILTLCAGTIVGLLIARESIREAQSRVRVREESYRSAAAHAEARRQRAVELAADPVRARYAPLVERGEAWSDAHIAYYENPALVATCTHLQPLERSIRAAGIDVRLLKDLQVSAHCKIDFARLQQTFGTGEPIHYSEFYMGDPEYHERPAAFLICYVHNAMIHTVHPDDSGPWFPPPGPTA